MTTGYVPAMLAAAALASLISGCSEPLGAAGKQGAFGGVLPRACSASPLRISSTIIEYGIVPQGSNQKHYLEIENTSTQPIEVERVETTCDCLHATMVAHRLKPTERTIIRLQLDLKDALDFVGVLDIDVAALSKDGTTAFSLTAHATVRPVSEFAMIEEDEPVRSRAVSVPVPMP